MTNKRYNAIKANADKLVKKIDKFIDEINEGNEYTAFGLIMNRLLIKASVSDVEDICFELELQENIKTFKIDGLNQEIRLEEFLQGIKENPYQLQLIA